MVKSRLPPRPLNTNSRPTLIFPSSESCSSDLVVTMVLLSLVVSWPTSTSSLGMPSVENKPLTTMDLSLSLPQSRLDALDLKKSTSPWTAFFPLLAQTMSSSPDGTSANSTCLKPWEELKFLSTTSSKNSTHTWRTSSLNQPSTTLISSLLTKRPELTMSFQETTNKSISSIFVRISENSRNQTVSTRLLFSGLLTPSVSPSLPQEFTIPLRMFSMLLRILSTKSLLLPSMPSLQSSRDAVTLMDLPRTLLFQVLSNSPSKKMFSSSEMISSLDKLRLRLHWLISSSVLVSSLSPLFPTIILVTTTAWTCLLRDNSNQRNSARNLVLMISSLPTKFSILNLLRSTTKSSLSTFHTLVTLRKLWMSIALRFSSVDNRLTCSTMSAKIPYSLLPWFSIWSF